MDVHFAKTSCDMLFKLLRGQRRSCYTYEYLLPTNLRFHDEGRVGEAGRKITARLDDQFQSDLWTEQTYIFVCSAHEEGWKGTHRVSWG